MRICHLATNFLPRQGGAEYAVHYLSKYLGKLGVDSTVHAAWIPNAPEVELPYDIHRYRYLPGVAAQRSKLLHLAVERLRSRFDVLHAHMAYEPGYWAALYKRRRDVPVVITVQGGDVQVVPEINYGARLKPGVDEKLRIALQEADVVGCVSERTRGLVLECGGIPERTDVIRNGTEFHEISRIPFDNVRQRLGIGPDEFVMITVGRMHPVKGIPNLLDASVIMKARGIRHRLLIVGADDKVAEAVAERDLQDVVIPVPPVPKFTSDTAAKVFDTPYPELINLYRVADVYVVASYVEAFSLAAMDAMAIGIPCVVTNMTGNAEIIEDGVTGLVIERSSVDAIVRAITSLHEDRERVRRMGDAARKVAERYDWGRIAEEYMAHYERLLATPRR